ncbi:MAG: hypothetical protein V4510_13210 [bacterium]
MRVVSLWEEKGRDSYDCLSGDPNLASALLSRLRRRIRVSTNQTQVIEEGRNTFTVRGVAGYVRLNRTTAVEVVPKFLDPADPSWRDDFLLLSTIATRGALDVSSALGFRATSASIPDAIGAALATSIQRAMRRPMFEYRRDSWYSFQVSGEIVPDAFHEPNPDGFRQRGLRHFDTTPETEVIRQALGRLQPEVRSPAVRVRLRGLAGRIQPQTSPSGRRPKARLAPRHTRWQPAYDLAKAYLAQGGLSLDKPVHEGAPGFMLPTAPTWERFLTNLLAQYHGAAQVERGKLLFGESRFLPSGPTVERFVHPDIVVRPPTSLVLLVDAKYKASIESERRTIARPDVYEALAFAKAYEATTVVLLYPGLAEPDTLPGTVAAFERFTTAGVTVHGVSMAVAGLARHKLSQTANRLAQGLQGIVDAV